MSALIRINVLPQQRHFPNPLLREFINLRDHFIKRSTELFAAGVRHHTERTILAASFHHGHVRSWPLTARRHQLIEFLNLGKTDIDFGAPFTFQRVQHDWKSMIGLRSKHKIHIRSAPKDELTLLTGNTSANTNHQIRSGFFPLSPTPELRKYFFLRLLTH